MGLKVATWGTYKTGKTAFILSMCELGPIYSIDNEDGQRYYLRAKEGGVRKEIGKSTLLECTLAPHVADLLGLSKTHSIYWLPTEMFGHMQEAMAFCMAECGVVGMGIDSGSILKDSLWDVADTQMTNAGQPLEGGLKYAKPKAWLRGFQNALKRSGLHYCWTAHEQDLFENNRPVKGQQSPDLEKRMPHWLDFIGRFRYNPSLNKAPRSEWYGRDGGMFAREGATKEGLTFKQLLEWVGEAPDLPMQIADAKEVLYANERIVLPK